MTFVSYSQNLEDVMLWRALKNVKEGFYVDVGANDPKRLSVTRAFYDHGWHGINIDPVTYDLLARDRLRDTNLNVAVSDESREINFYEVADSALCTSDPNLAEKYRNAGLSVSEKMVLALTLNQILAKHAETPIHFLNIDVEGGELQVLRGLDLLRWRPWIILIEATIPTTTIASFQEWEPLIVNAGYEFVYFDGLNRFYVAKEHSELSIFFSLPPNIFDEFVFYREVEKQEQLISKENVIQEQKQLIEDQKVVIQEQKKELDFRESIIHQYRTSYFYWFANSPFRRSWMTRLLVKIFGKK